MGTYEGWKNYETWAVNLCLDNDQGLYSQKQFMVRNAHRNETSVYEFADQIKTYVTDMAPELDGLWSDLMSAALSEVDWQEIAEAWLGEES